MRKASKHHYEALLQPLNKFYVVFVDGYSGQFSVDISLILHFIIHIQKENTLTKEFFFQLQFTHVQVAAATTCSVWTLCLRIHIERREMYFVGGTVPLFTIHLPSNDTKNHHFITVLFFFLLIVVFVAAILFYMLSQVVFIRISHS